MTAALELTDSHALGTRRALGTVLARAVASEPRWSPTITRIAFGGVIAAHGAQKLLGWFGGAGFEHTMAFFTDTIGMPAPLGVLVIVLESFGALALVLGAATRPLAISLAAVMLGAVVTVHAPAGFFFMDWFGQQEAEGIEFFVLAIAMCAALAIDGGGRYSLDRVLARRLESR